jgi:hypothetical protein
MNKWFAVTLGTFRSPLTHASRSTWGNPRRDAPASLAAGAIADSLAAGAIALSVSPSPKGRG